MKVFHKIMMVLLVLGLSSCLCRLQFNEFSLDDQDLALIADFNSRGLIYVDNEGNQYNGQISNRQREIFAEDTECERNTLEAAFVDIEITDLEVDFRVSVLKTDVDRSFFDIVRTDVSEFFFIRDCSNTNIFNCKVTTTAEEVVYEGVLDWEGRDSNVLVNRIIYKPEIGIVYFSFEDGRSFQLEQQL